MMMVWDEWAGDWFQDEPESAEHAAARAFDDWYEQSGQLDAQERGQLDG